MAIDDGDMPTQKAVRTSARRARAVDLSAPPTHERIIVAAERLFAASGMADVSLRDIAAAAGQKNNVAVQYHFGDRENLLRQIVLYRSEPHKLMTRKVLQRMKDDRVPMTTRDIVSDYCAYLAGYLDDGSHFLPFLSRFLAERGELDGLRSVLSKEVIAILKFAVSQTLPAVPEAVIERRWPLLMASAVHCLSNYQTLRARGGDVASLEETMEDLVRFLTGGLQAPHASQPERSHATLRPNDPGTDARFI